MNFCGTTKINSDGHLEIGGIDCLNLVRDYGTPLYAIDESCIRKACKGSKDILTEQYPDSSVLYASKAFCALAIYKIIQSEGLGLDVVSGGELYTALKAGMSPHNIYFHGNNKSSNELNYAVCENVYAIVIDSDSELDTLNNIAENKGKIQKVLVRVNPGIDAHTHRFIQTTRPDSKFGFALSDGTATEIIRKIYAKKNLKFIGLHCHIGSQIFELKPFELAVEKMTDYIRLLNKDYGIEVDELNMGGGYGVKYTDEDKPLKPQEYVSAIVSKLKECVLAKKIKAPKLIIEPGRSIVGEAGITLYTVGSVKEIKGLKKYIATDGGMFENPRYALYQSKYSAVIANKASESKYEKVTVAGKCCESGDILIEDIDLPKTESGDILAVFTTGAYNYSMASNYNRNAIPPVVLVNNGKSEYIIKPQSYEDIISRDAVPQHLEKANK